MVGLSTVADETKRKKHCRLSCSEACSEAYVQLSATIDRRNFHTKKIIKPPLLCRHW